MEHSSPNQRGKWNIRPKIDSYDIFSLYEVYPEYFTIKLHHGGSMTDYPGRTYEKGQVHFVDLVDSKKFSVNTLDDVRGELGYDEGERTYYHYVEPGWHIDGLKPLSTDENVMKFLKLIDDNKIIEVYVEHGKTNVYYAAKSTSQSQAEPSHTFDPFFNVHVECDKPKRKAPAALDSDSEDADYVADEVDDVDSESDSEDVDYVDEEEVHDVDVDMRDYKQNIDDDINDHVSGNEYMDEVVDNETFHSGSESDENIATKQFRNLRRENEKNPKSFKIGQVFGTKLEIKKMITNVSVQTRRQLKITKDEGDRIRVVCAGEIPNFEINAEGGLCQSQKRTKGKSPMKKTDDVGLSQSQQRTKHKGPMKKNGDVGKEKKVKEAAGVGGSSNAAIKKHVGGRGKKKDPTEYLCPWTLFVSIHKESNSWVVKTLIDEHACLQSRTIKKCTASFLSQQIIDQMEENPTIPAKAVQEQLQRKFQVNVSKMKAYRARSKALKEVQGDYNSQYGFLRDYLSEIKRTNPGTTVFVEVEQAGDPDSNTRKFQRVYRCLGPLKEGFRAIGRQMLGFDGAFMKGPFPGQILTAVGLDNNNCIYPLAYAVVEAENSSSWSWFIKCVGDDLNLTPESSFTFVSDRQKGILQAISDLYPYAEHRFCLRHILENMKQNFKGQVYRDILWKLGSSTTVRQFEHFMKELKGINTEAQLWVSKIPPEHWSRSHFSGRAKSDVLVNNMCEVMNSKIVEGRDKPIISCLEYIREYLMRRIVNVLQIIDKSEGPLTPTATKWFDLIKKDATNFTVAWNGGDHYQVTGPYGEQRVVDVAQKTCACRKWEITGMPCKHAVATIWTMARNDHTVGLPETWMDPVYLLATWKNVYNFKIFPINDRSLWPKCTIPILLTPPTHRRPIGRPKKVRKKSVVELEEMTKGGKLSKKNCTVRCGKCKNQGHNSRSCDGRGGAA